MRIVQIVRLLGMLAVVGTLWMGLGGCTTYQRRPTTISYDRSQRVEIWNRAVMLLQERNYPLRILNEASGTITTDPVQTDPVSCGIFTCYVRQSVSLTVSPTGTIICNINRVLTSSALPNEPFIPQDEENVGRVEQAQQEIVRAILGGPVPSP